MPFHILLADSEISFVERREQTFLIHLSAASAERSQALEQMTSKGYCTRVLLQLDGYRVHENNEPLVGRIDKGTLWIDGQLQHCCGLPSTHNKSIKLQLELDNRASLIVSASTLSLNFEGEPDFHESLAC